MRLLIVVLRRIKSLKVRVTIGDTTNGVSVIKKGDVTVMPDKQEQHHHP
jgi:Ethanolamine utilization protein EutJ (predicted chaperonin)